MSTHLQLHRAEMEKLAYPAVQHFITRHPQYAISPDQHGSVSATNYIIFGQRNLTQGDDEPVIFKYFCEDERKAREVYALHHYAHTGLVPQLLAEEGKRLIVQSRIPGGWLPNPEDATDSSANSQLAGYTLGEAVATLVDVPLSAEAARAYEQRFYEGLPLAQYFRHILDASWQIHQRVEAYRAPLFAHSLDAIEANLPYIMAQTRLLYHQDAMNMHFRASKFVGFFDLEMCRVGTEAMQIGSLWNIFITHQNWPAFVQGFGAHSGRTLGVLDFAAAHAFAHFLVWRYISRYGRWRADPLDTERRAQAEVDAPMYASFIVSNNQVQPSAAK